MTGQAGDQVQIVTKTSEYNDATIITDNTNLFTVQSVTFSLTEHSYLSDVWK